MTPSRQKLIKEIHPELCFYEMNDRRGMRHSKKERTGVGLTERRKLLIEAGFDEIASGARSYPKSKVREDDVLDACAACWTAIRIFRDEAVRIPTQLLRDKRELRMEMWR